MGYKFCFIVFIFVTTKRDLGNQLFLLFYYYFFAERTSQRTIVTYNICTEEIKSFHVQFLYHVSVPCIYSS